MEIERFPKRAVFAACTAGFALHAYIGIFEVDGGPGAFTLGLFAWSCTPYLGCLLVARLLGNGRLPAFCGALAALLGDLANFYAVFMSPTSSTAALGLLVVPLLNLVVLAPAGILLGYGVRRVFRAGTTS